MDLRRRLGISYKDSAHRLYMTELERLKKADSAARLAAAQEERLEMFYSDCAAAILAIDEWRLDGNDRGVGSSRQA